MKKTTVVVHAGQPAGGAALDKVGNTQSAAVFTRFLFNMIVHCCSISSQAPSKVIKLDDTVSACRGLVLLRAAQGRQGVTAVVPEAGPGMRHFLIAV